MVCRHGKTRYLPAPAPEKTGIPGSMSYGPSLRPSKIKFTRDSINQQFGNGTSIADAARMLAECSICRDDEGLEKAMAGITVMNVVAEWGGTFWSMDNRRLALFRLLELANVLDTVAVHLVPKDWPEWKRKFTTKNNGTCAVLRQTKWCVGESEATTTFPLAGIIAVCDKARTARHDDPRTSISRFKKLLGAVFTETSFWERDDDIILGGDDDQNDMLVEGM